MRPSLRLVIYAIAAGLVCAAAPIAHAQSGSRVTVYTAFDSDFLYAAAVVQKPNLAGTHSAPFSDVLKDDAIAFFVQAGDPGLGGRRTDRSVQMVVSAAGGAQLYRGGGVEPLRGFDDFRATPDGVRYPFKVGVTRRGELGSTAGTQITDAAYSVEIAIPWIELGGAPAVGERVRFNVVSFSVAPGSAPLTSLAPGVRSAEDLQLTSHWGELVFADAPARSVASAPNARVAARVYAARPLIDGTVAEGEWSRVTSFSFEETAGGASVVTAGGSLAEARIRPNLELKPAPPALPVPAHAPRAVGARAPMAAPRLVLALYDYDYQADPRKAVPVSPVRTAQGQTLLASHPLTGDGPWLTYDRVDWHREQVRDMRLAGVDVALPVFRADAASRQAYAVRGLIALTAALRKAAQDGADYPLVGMYLDASSFAGTGGALDLGAQAGRDRLYAAVRDFYLHVPAPFRAVIPLSAENGGNAHILVLSTAAGLAGLDTPWLQDLRARFAGEFGADLVVLGGADLRGKADMDGYVAPSRGIPYHMEADARLRVATISPGCDTTLTGGSAFRPRKGGVPYRTAWRQALTAGAEWVVLDGWTAFRTGSALAPTLEDGITFTDLTRQFSLFLHAAGGPNRAEVLWHGIAPTVAAGAASRWPVRILNASSQGWSVTSHTVAFAWQGGQGEAMSGSAPLPRNVMPGESAVVQLPVRAPSAPGAWRLVVHVAPVDKKGAPAIPAGAAPALAAPVGVAAADGGQAPAYAASVVTSTVPAVVEAGGAYAVSVTLRNDGTRPWRKAEGGRVTARIYRTAAGADALTPLADATAPLPADVPPGAEVTVPVQLALAESTGAALPVSSPGEGLGYVLRWEVSDGAAGGALTGPQALAVVDADLGAAFTRDTTPANLPGERRIPVRLSIRNDGPQTWRREFTRVGYHWYYADGTEALWEDETTPIPQDLPPGADTGEMLVWVTAPPNDGVYWLVWDLKVGDTWASTLPGVRAIESLVRRVEVVRGRLAFGNMDRAYNIDGVSPSDDRTNGNFDGSGASLPAELAPPFVGTRLAPATMWMPATTSGLDSPRKLSFRWGPKGADQPNIAACAGQRIPIDVPKNATERSRAVHVLAAATRDGVNAAFIVVFADGSQQLVTLPIKRWDAPPGPGDTVGYAFRYTHTRSGEEPGKPGYLYRYVLPTLDRTARPVAAVILPNAPDVRVAAITVER